REWWRFPQEAHILDPERARYRRLSAAEVGILQGFSADWAAHAGLGELDQIRGYGDAVPPPLAEALATALREGLDASLERGVGVCAVLGGLALGITGALRIRHIALVEKWKPAFEVLRASGVWPVETIFHEDVTTFDWGPLAGKVDLLTG